MKSKIRTILAAMLIAVLLLAGCNLSGLGKPSVVSLTNSAITNLGKVNSAEVNVKTDGDITAVYEALNIGMNINLDTDSNMEVTKDTGRSRGTVGVTVGAVGQEQTINGEFYKESLSGGSTTYVQWEEGDWLKKTAAGKQEASEEENSSEGITMPGSIMQMAGMLKYLADGSLEAELKEETVQVNDQEAYQITSTLGGDFLKGLIDSGLINLQGLSLEEADIDWSTVSIPAEIYIYKESKLPARITLDCTSFGSQIVGNMLKEELEQLPIGDIRLDVNKFLVDITIDRYDEVEAFEIPSETASASEAESLAPAITDLFHF